MVDIREERRFEDFQHALEGEILPDQEPSLRAITVEEVLNGIQDIVSFSKDIAIKSKEGMIDAAKHPAKVLHELISESIFKILHGSLIRISRIGFVDFYIALLTGGGEFVENFIKRVKELLKNAENFVKVPGFLLSPFLPPDYERFNSIAPLQKERKEEIQKGTKEEVKTPEQHPEITRNYNRIPSVDLVPDATPVVPRFVKIPKGKEEQLETSR